jgi:hypothetical protein
MDSHDPPTAKEIADMLWGVRDWMRFRAEDYESGLCQHLQRIDGKMADISVNETVDLRTYADQIEAFAKRVMENA